MRAPVACSDIHLHHLPGPFLEWMLAHPGASRATLGPLPGRKGQQWLTVGGRWPFPLHERFSDADALANEMDRAGVARAALSPPPQVFYYWAEPELAQQVCRRVNDGLLAVARVRPGRFWVLGQVPLQVPDAAAAELERLLDQGAAGAMIGTDVEGVALDDARLAPFWSAADRRRAVVFVHPLMGQGPGMDRLFLANLLGNPVETAIAAAGLMLTGHLDRYRQVRLVLAHGGGVLPYQIGRLDFGFRTRDEARGGSEHPPLRYLSRFWFDTVVWDRRALRFLLDLVGPDRVALGSDFPFILTTWPHSETLEALAAMESGVLEQVARHTAAALLGEPIR